MHGKTLENITYVGKIKEILLQWCFRLARSLMFVLSHIKWDFQEVVLHSLTESSQSLRIVLNLPQIIK